MWVRSSRGRLNCRPIRCPPFQRGCVWTTDGIVIAESEGKAVDFGDLVPLDCVLRRLSKELFALAFPALSTWKTVKDYMASKGNSWSLVHSEDLPEGLSDKDEGDHSSEETPSISGSSKVVGSEDSWVARSYFSIVDVEGLEKYRHWYQIHEDVVLRIPDLDERACSSKYDDVAFYEADFRASLRTAIACMVMWRVCSKGANSFTMEELIYCYKPCQIAVSPGFWTLNMRQRNLKLITSLPSSNREWKDDYIFVCGDNWEGLPWEEKDDSFVRVHREWGVPSSSAMRRPKVNQEGQNRVLRALHHKDHHYTKFIQPNLLALYSFGPELSQEVLSLDLTNQRNSSSKKLVEKHGPCPSTTQETITLEQAPASSIELVEPPSTPSSSRAIEKAPTLPKDASLALRRAQSIVTKEDVDEYAKLNTDIVKRALAHSLMKDGLVKLKNQLLEAAEANQTLMSVANELTQEKDRMENELASLKGDMTAKDAKLEKALDENKRVAERLQQAKEKYPDIDFDVFQPYKDDDSVMPADGNDGTTSADPQLDDDATN
uniref:Uncharacterized protein n=1 Tax=Fagus sylvatica TaxID=28930 RepID=A0A2N9J2K4_FAGSY